MKQIYSIVQMVHQMAQIIQHHGCSEVSILATKSVFSFP